MHCVHLWAGWSVAKCVAGIPAGEWFYRFFWYILSGLVIKNGTTFWLFQKKNKGPFNQNTLNCAYDHGFTPLFSPESSLMQLYFHNWNEITTLCCFKIKNKGPFSQNTLNRPYYDDGFTFFSPESSLAQSYFVDWKDITKQGNILLELDFFKLDFLKMGWYYTNWLL